MTGILGKYLAGKEAGEQRKDRLPAQLERLQQMNVARQEREQAKALQRAGDILQHTESWLHDPDARLKATDVEVNTYLKLNNEQRTLFGLPPMETAPDPVGDLMQKDILNIQQGGFKVRKMMGADYTPDARIQAIGGASNFMLTKYGDYWVKFLRNTYNQHVLAQGAAQQAAPTQAGADAKQPFAAPPAEPMVPFDPDEIGRKIFEDSFPNPVTETALSPELARIATQLTPEDATALGGLTGHPQLGSLGGSAARAAAVAPPSPEQDRLIKEETRQQALGAILMQALHDSLSPPTMREFPGKSQAQIMEILVPRYASRKGIPVTRADITSFMAATGAMETRAGIAGERVRRAGESDADWALRLRQEWFRELVASGQGGTLPSVPGRGGGGTAPATPGRPYPVPKGPIAPPPGGWANQGAYLGGLPATGFTPKPTAANAPTFDPYTEQDAQGRNMLHSMGVVGPRQAVSNLLGTGVKVNATRLKTYLRDMADVQQLPNEWMLGQPIRERRRAWKAEIAAALRVTGAAVPTSSRLTKTDQLNALVKKLTQ